MTRRRLFGMMLGASAAAGALLACTLTQSLDYLQKGDGDGGTGADVVSENAPPAGDGGQEGGSKNGEVLVPNQTKPGLLAQDALSLYWVSAGTVMSVAKSGGAPKIYGVLPAATYLAVDPDPQGSIFVAVGNDIWRFPKAGGDGGVVFTSPAATPAVDTVKADESTLFVLQYDLAGDSSQIRKMAKDGTARVDIDDGGTGSGASILTIDSQTLFWMDSSQSPTTFYELAKNAPVGTKATELPLLVDDQYPETTADLAVDDTDMYWISTDATTGAPLIISRKRQKGAPAITVFQGPAADGKYRSIALDATNVFVIELKSSTVLRVSKQGGPTSNVVVDGLAKPSSLVVDDTHVYVTAEGTGSTGAVVKQKK